MSTSVINNTNQVGQDATNGNISSNTTVETEDVVVGYTITADADGKKVKTPAIYSAGEAVEKMKTEGKFEEDFTVTTKLSLPKTLDALLDLYKTPEEQEEGVNNHNRGVRQKVVNRRNARLLAQTDDGNFAFSEKDLTDGRFFDLTPEIASPSKRRSLSEEEKLDRFLEQFPENIRQNMKAAYLSSKNVGNSAQISA